MIFSFALFHFRYDFIIVIQILFFVIVTDIVNEIVLISLTYSLSLRIQHYIVRVYHRLLC